MYSICCQKITTEYPSATFVFRTRKDPAITVRVGFNDGGESLSFESWLGHTTSLLDKQKLDQVQALACKAFLFILFNFLSIV